MINGRRNRILNGTNYRRTEGRTVVIKAGGSVFTSNEAYSRFAKDCLKFLDGHRAEGVDRLIIVPSAKQGATNELIERYCRECGGNPRTLDRILRGETVRSQDFEAFNNSSVADYLLGGEKLSAFVLRNAFRELGVPDEELLQLTQGINHPVIVKDDASYLRATVNYGLTANTLSRNRIGATIIIAAGFGGQTAGGREGRTALLGRNASDYVAACMTLADPNADTVYFLKDVPGIYRDFGRRNQRLVREISPNGLSEIMREEGVREVIDDRCLEFMTLYYPAYKPLANKLSYVVTNNLNGARGTTIRDDQIYKPASKPNLRLERVSAEPAESII